jgi:predicted nuclease of predicted toxin-antitoxin system
MKALIDENVPPEVVEALAEVGIVGIHVREVLSGANDATILDCAQRFGAAIITFDKDFGDLVFRQKLPVPGVLLLRTPAMPGSELRTLVRAYSTAVASQILGHFLVLSVAGLRVKPLGEI